MSEPNEHFPTEAEKLPSAALERAPTEAELASLQAAEVTVKKAREIIRRNQMETTNEEFSKFYSKGY